MSSDGTRVFLPVDEPLSPVSIAILKPLLAAQGLHVVSAADKAVLDAMGDVPTDILRDWINLTVHVRHIPTCHGLAEAELARREAKP